MGCRQVSAIKAILSSGIFWAACIPSAIAQDCVYDMRTGLYRGSCAIPLRAPEQVKGGTVVDPQPVGAPKKTPEQVKGGTVVDPPPLGVPMQPVEQVKGGATVDQQPGATPTNAPQSAPPPPASLASVRTQFYAAIMNYVRPQTITRGRPEYIGKTFANVYARAVQPKALTMCVNWSDSTPDHLAFAGSNSWQFVTRTGSCGPNSKARAAECALRDCRAYARCGGPRQCTLVDINDSNNLQIPTAWIRRFGLAR
jgi:hypothetical protein